MPEAVGRIFADEAFKTDAKKNVFDFLFSSTLIYFITFHQKYLNDMIKPNFKTAFHRFEYNSYINSSPHNLDRRNDQRYQGRFQANSTEVRLDGRHNSGKSDRKGKLALNNWTINTFPSF